MTNITWDIETNGLLNNSSIDYNSSPYKLKPNFKMHCIVVERHDTDEIIAFYNGNKYELDGREYVESDGQHFYTLSDYEEIEYTHKQLWEFPAYVSSLKNLDKVIGHNILNFDLLAVKLYFEESMHYSVAYPNTNQSDRWIGSKKVNFVDTLVLSKLFNPDRLGGHSLDNLSKIADGVEKFEFRKNIKPEDRFNTFAADMLYYNIMDVKANTSVYKHLLKEGHNWDWHDAIRLEKKVVDVVTNQEHRGFYFNKELAEECVKELDSFMEERRNKVEPLLPPKKATQAFLKNHTPSTVQVLEKEVKLPKSFFDKKGLVTKTGINWLNKWDAHYDEDDDEIYVPHVDKLIVKVWDEEQEKHCFPEVAFVEKSISANMKKFVEKHNGSYNEKDLSVELFGETYQLPIEVKPLKTTMVATIDDTTHIKGWLVSLGWNPTDYKTKDITLKSGTKIKRNTEDLIKAVERYANETMESEFKQDRIKPLKARPTFLSIKNKILQKAEKQGVKVLTNPSFTIGQDKELCPDLERVAKEFPYVKDVVEYLTFKHRRNSILGGDVEWDSDEEPEKGYLANIRDDGRIPTPAGTCDAATSRMKHRIVVNVPRPSSLYGEKIRQLFGVKGKYLQLGYDFASLEARAEAHRCWKFDKDKEYCNSLLLPKPNDVHSKTAKRISEVLNISFSRDNAKNVRYALSYGGSVKRVQQIMGGNQQEATQVYDAFWESAKPLERFKNWLTNKWETEWNKKYIIGLDGRKIFTRSKHSLVNSQLQSDGVICAKYVLVLLDYYLKENNLRVDFFRDDWKNKEYCNSMICMHDEQQTEISKSLVKWKQFDSQEEVDKFIKEYNITGSSTVEKNGKFYLGVSKVMNYINQAVEDTNSHFKLNVPLKVDFDLGTNWAECH